MKSSNITTVFYFATLILLLATVDLAQSYGCGRYNHRLYTCCAGVLNRRTGSSTGCCGTRAYNIRLYACCAGVLSRKSGSHTGCCGTRSYSIRLYSCCNRVLRRGGCGRSRFRYHWPKIIGMGK